MQKLHAHNAEFNPSNVAEPSRKRAIDTVSSESKRARLQGLEEADLAELMKVSLVSIAEHTKYTMLLAPAADSDSAGTVWIASKFDMDLAVDDVLFSFGSGRHLARC